MHATAVVKHNYVYQVSPDHASTDMFANTNGMHEDSRMLHGILESDTLLYY